MLKQTDDRKQQNWSRIKLQQMEEKVKVRAQNQKKSAPNARLKKWKTRSESCDENEHKENVCSEE